MEESVSFEGYQEKRNREFYSKKGPGFKKEFKTFASDIRFVRALAADFHRKMRAVIEEKKIIRVYEFGVGDGSLGTKFMLELRKLSEALSEKTIYHFCDFSEELVRNAAKRADAFGFNADGIVYDAVKGEPKFLVEPDYIIMSEFYDDLPAKMLVRKGKEIMEIMVEEERKKPAPFEGDEELKEYMGKMPEDYYIPINVIAKKHLDFCASKIKGYIDVFDYGFRIEDIGKMPAVMWNNSITREFGGQITTDVNFDFLSGKLNAKTETQLEFVEGVLGIKLHEVETDKLRYLTEEEIETSGKELEKHGYSPGFHKDLKESRGYLHMRVE